MRMVRLGQPLRFAHAPSQCGKNEQIAFCLASAMIPALRAHVRRRDATRDNINDLLRQLEKLRMQESEARKRRDESLEASRMAVEKRVQVERDLGARARPASATPEVLKKATR